MCTAITYQTSHFYFGRTLDHGQSYHEEITITPRNFPLPFRCLSAINTHYAMIGMAHVTNNYPLYYDAVNEQGLAMAGLNFPGNAYYAPKQENARNVASFEFIPYILGQCSSVAQVKKLLNGLNLIDTAFSAELPPASLHWIIADRQEAITVEFMADGLHVYPNSPGVLTNNPPFPEQLSRLNDYIHLTAQEPENRFSPSLPLEKYTLGLGAIGLPGDLSSASRFVRAVFTKLNSVTEPEEAPSVCQFFHILSTVSQTRGCCRLSGGGYETTLYTSCCNADTGVYYYTTYENQSITAVDLHQAALDSSQLICYPLVSELRIHVQNSSTEI